MSEDESSKFFIGVVKPGDIVLVEAHTSVSKQGYENMRAMLEASAKELGIKVLVLPPLIRVVKVEHKIDEETGRE